LSTFFKNAQKVSDNFRINAEIKKIKIDHEINLKKMEELKKYQEEQARIQEEKRLEEIKLKQEDEKIKQAEKEEKLKQVEQKDDTGIYIEGKEDKIDST